MSNLAHVVSSFFIYCLPSKSKPFGILEINKVVISVKSLLTEIPPLLADMMTKNFDFNASSLKFIYSEKATKFCEIFPLLFFLSVCTVEKSKWKILQNFVAFSEYMNFIFGIIFQS